MTLEFDFFNDDVFVDFFNTFMNLPILAPTYYMFLDEEDRCILTYLCDSSTVKGKVNWWLSEPPDGPGAPKQQVKRMREALDLCQFLALLPVEDVRRGGYVHMHCKRDSEKDDMHELPIETLAQKYPRLAVEEDTFHLYSALQQKVQDDNSLQLGKGGPRVYKESKKVRRPRNFKAVMKSASGQSDFERYLKQFNAHRAILFYQEVEKVKNLDCRLQQVAVDKILTHFFRRTNAEERLQCNAPIISQITEMRFVTVDVLYAAQEMVANSLELKWFSKYQGTFPMSKKMRALKRPIIFKGKPKRVWDALTTLIKTICEFHRSMRDSDLRLKFVAYLRHHWADYSTECETELEQAVTVGKHADDSDSAHFKRRVVNEKVLTVDLLANDLAFYLETERYREIADTSKKMASEGIFGKHENTISLYQKAKFINDTFFSSELSSIFRINIPDTMSKSIEHSFSVGKVDGRLFSDAILIVFPTLIYCWKKYCTCKLNVLEEIEKEEVLPDYLDPFGPTPKSDWYRNIPTTWTRTGDQPTMHFSLQSGLRLVLPDIKQNSAGHPGSHNTATTGPGTRERPK